MNWRMMQSRPGRARGILLATGCLLTIAVGVLLAHEGHAPLPSQGAQVNLATGQIILSADATAVLDVQSVEIGTSPPPDHVLAYATLVTSWRGHAFAVSPLPGRIVALHAKPGDRVEAGTLLAEIQSQEAEILQLQIQSSYADVQLAEVVYAGMKQAVGTVPERDIVDAEVQLRQTENTLDLAKVKWLSLGLPPDALENLLVGKAESTPALPIRSPINGTLTHTDLTLGKVVATGEHLFEVIDLSTVWAKVGVLEKDLPRISQGLPVTIGLTAYPGEVFRGTVAIVGEYLDPVTHLNDIWVEFSNPSGQEPRLLPGMYGQARIELPPERGTMTVPSTALIDNGVDQFVLVEEASASSRSEFRRTSVVVVRATPEVVEVRSPNLFPGDRVVSMGGHELGAFFAPGVVRLTPEVTGALGLEVEPVTIHPVETVIEVPGAVDLPPERRSVAASSLAGTIRSIQVDRGQHVQPGDVLAEVFSLDLLDLQLDLLREHLAAELANRQLALVREAKDSVPKRTVIEAESAAAMARNRRDSLRRQLEVAGLTTDQLDALVNQRQVVLTLPLRATVAGTVVAFDRMIGQTVRADEPLFEIHDLTSPWVQGFVTEQELTQVYLGQSVRVRLIASPEEVLEGKVSRSGRTFGATHRTLSVWMELEDHLPITLRHNQMARLALVIESPPPVLAVPLSALVREGTRTYVFVENDDIFERRSVELGRRDDRFAEIKAGLTAGERIAVNTANELHTAWASVR